MALYPIDRKTFDALASAAEGRRQASMRGVTNQAVADSIHCQYFTDVINAGALNSITTINEITAFQSLGCAALGFSYIHPFILDQSQLGGTDVLGT